MHAQRIIQDFLASECPSMHAKRRICLALMTDAARRGGLGLVKMSKAIKDGTPFRYRLKRCDRMLSNPHLDADRVMVFRALAHRLLQGKTEIAIIVDWSDLLRDVSQHVLRAAVVVQGRAFVIYEEVHPTEKYGKECVHRAFMKTLRTVLPDDCRPVIITDAGFRATWFKMLDQFGYAWIGRIRNRDMVRSCDGGDWQGCKMQYVGANGHARDLGQFDYARSNPVPCRLVVIKKLPKGRHSTTVFGNKSCSRHSKKQSQGQSEPWLLAVSPLLAKLGVKAIVAMYGRRMQIEQTFRDLKNAQWGMGLSTSQTRKPRRMAALLLIAALLSFALWLIGLAARASGYSISYGSRLKARTTLSILSLARSWLDEPKRPSLTPRQLDNALIELAAMVMTYEI
jgi:hypothetical protein